MENQTWSKERNMSTYLNHFYFYQQSGIKQLLGQKGTLGLCFKKGVSAPFVLHNEKNLVFVMG